MYRRGCGRLMIGMEPGNFAVAWRDRGSYHGHYPRRPGPNSSQNIEPIVARIAVPLWL